MKRPTGPCGHCRAEEKGSVIKEISKNDNKTKKNATFQKKEKKR